MDKRLLFTRKSSSLVSQGKTLIARHDMLIVLFFGKSSVEGKPRCNRSKSFGRDDWERNAQSMNWFAAALPLVQNHVGVCYSIQAFFQIEAA